MPSTTLQTTPATALLPLLLLFCCLPPTTCLLRCVDEQNVELMIGDLWQKVPGQQHKCDAQKWCIWTSGDGLMYMDQGTPPSPFRGTLQKCAHSNTANQICNDMGEACRRVTEFQPLVGNLTVCCCQTDLCNSHRQDNSYPELARIPTTSRTQQQQRQPHNNNVVDENNNNNNNNNNRTPKIVATLTHQHRHQHTTKSWDRNNDVQVVATTKPLDQDRELELNAVVPQSEKSSAAEPVLRYYSTLPLTIIATVFVVCL